MAQEGEDGGFVGDAEGRGGSPLGGEEYRAVVGGADEGRGLEVAQDGTAARRTGSGDTTEG